MPCQGGKDDAFAIVLVELERRKFRFSSFTKNNLSVRPGIQQPALAVTARLNFNMINPAGILAGGNQKPAAGLKVVEGNFVHL